MLWLLIAIYLFFIIYLLFSNTMSWFFAMKSLTTTNPLKSSFFTTHKNFFTYCLTYKSAADPAHGPGESFEGNEKYVKKWVFLDQKKQRFNENLKRMPLLTTYFVICFSITLFTLFILVLKHWHRYLHAPQIKYVQNMQKMYVPLLIFKRSW